MTDMSLSDVVTDGEPGSRRRGQRAADRRRKRRRRRTWVSVLVVMLVVGGASYGAYVGIRPILAAWNEPDDFTGEGTSAVTVTIPDGASGTQIASVLRDAGVVRTSKAFIDAFDGEPRAASIQPGAYALRAQMSASAALAALLDPATRQGRVTIPEGRRLGQILDVLAKATGKPRADFVAASKDAEALGLPASAKGNAEGYLFPSTYDLTPDQTPEEILAAMVERGRAAIAEIGVPEDREHAVLTLASIVQVEAGTEEDMGKVARVFMNRLTGANFPLRRLQSDATVNYATNSFGITTTPKQRQSPSPYNTYRRAGLPPGPVASPGEAALRAALDPPPGRWIYFVTVNPDTGETRFAETDEEHAANTKTFQKWLRENPGN